MLEIINLSLTLNLNVPGNRIIEIGLQSYDLAQEAKKRFFNYPDSNVHVWVEQGSINYKYKVGVGLVTLYNIVSGIDGFVGGIEKIVSYCNNAMTYITQKSIDNEYPQNTKVISHQRSTGLIKGRLDFQVK